MFHLLRLLANRNGDLAVPQKTLSRVGGINWKNVVAGARTIEHRMGEDPKFAAEVEGIKASLVPKVAIFLLMPSVV